MPEGDGRGGPAELVERVDERDRVIGVVERGEAIRRGWPHRVAVVVCRDTEGRILVHRRPGGVSRFPGRYNWLVGGAVEVGESYRQAAEREAGEELGVRIEARFRFSFLCRGELGPYWIGVHEAVLGEEIRPDPDEIAWCGRLTEEELSAAVRRWPFVGDSLEVLARYLALPGP
ncbi:NUDIX domain-containing protein [Streptomyces sp. CAU 1734]|uniref:NUDIX hydrolase n=1 Tax=Streptomyces sp. CAU 1734 TaxID=3140360 RepID=UPI003260DEC2